MHNIKRNQAPHPPHPKHTQRLNSSLPQKEELNERKQKKKILHPHESGPICSHLASSLIDVLHWWWCTQLQKIFHRFRSCLIRTKPQLQPGGKDGMEKKKGEKVERDLSVLSFSLSFLHRNESITSRAPDNQRIVIVCITSDLFTISFHRLFFLSYS
jgi:hypothetical protein